MLIPIRCFTCGSVTGDKWNVFCDRVKEKKKKSSEMVETQLIKLSDNLNNVELFIFSGHIITFSSSFLYLYIIFSMMPSS